METQRIALTRPITAGGMTVIAVEAVSLDCRLAGGGISAYAAKRPVAVVLVSAAGDKRAFRVSGEELSLDQLTQEEPSLAEALAGV